MANRKYGLAISIPDKKGKIYNKSHFLLTAQQISLGRGDENDIPLKNDAVSSRHCNLRRTSSGDYSITDLGSTNGTLFNGEELEKNETRNLRSGDILVIGLHVKAQFIQLKEIADSETKAQNTPAGGAVTQKLAKTPSRPRINPVAAAMAKAGKDSK